MFEYITVKTDDEYAAAAVLFKEYADSLDIDLSFQHFDRELAGLKSMYAPPLGGIILCRINSDFVGSIAIRPQEPGIAEIKRMYVKPLFRGRGTGEILLQRIIRLAKEYGYEKIRLDTLNTMTPAMNLYKKHGFTEVPPYYFNPEKTAVYFEKEL